MATNTLAATQPEQEAVAAAKIEQLRELFADAPEVGRAALEKVLQTLKRQASQTPPPPVESAGRTESRLGKVSELTVVHYNDAGQAVRILTNHRPLSFVLLWLQLMVEHFAGTRYAQYFLSRDAAAALHQATATR